MQTNVFEGYLAKDVVVNGEGDAAVSRFTLIANEYAGKDEQQNTKERVVALPFSAFGGRGKAIAEHCAKGDQLIVQFRIENNEFEKDGVKQYGFNFIVTEFSFG